MYLIITKPIYRVTLYAPIETSVAASTNVFSQNVAWKTKKYKYHDQERIQKLQDSCFKHRTSNYHTYCFLLYEHLDIIMYVTAITLRIKEELMRYSTIYTYTKLK